MKVKSKERVMNEAYIESLDPDERDELARQNITYKPLMYVFMAYFVIALIAVVTLGYAATHDDWCEYDIEDIRTRTHNMATLYCDTIGEEYFAYQVSNTYLVVECNETRTKIQLLESS